MAQKKLDIDIKTILTAGLLVGGYFAYTKFFKGKKGGLSDAGSPATGGGTPEIKI